MQCVKEYYGYSNEKASQDPENPDKRNRLILLNNDLTLEEKMNTVDPTVNWSQDQMVEVYLNEFDDFLKVRETLTRIGVASRKEKNSINLATFFISRVSIILSTSKNCLLWTVREQTLL